MSRRATLTDPDPNEYFGRLTTLLGNELRFLVIQETVPRVDLVSIRKFRRRKRIHPILRAVVAR